MCADTTKTDPLTPEQRARAEAAKCAAVMFRGAGHGRGDDIVAVAEYILTGHRRVTSASATWRSSLAAPVDVAPSSEPVA